MNSRAHIFVSGIVQGVYFREFTRTQATQSGLTGWVRNLPDRRVEAVAEGEREDLEQFITRLWTGPSESRVDDVSVEWEDYQGSFDSFRITF
jgi:acylphosphatase